MQGSGDGSLQRGPGAEPLVGLGGKAAQKRGSVGGSRRSLTYFDYLTVV